jgi:hypothetical protein
MRFLGAPFLNKMSDYIYPFTVIFGTIALIAALHDPQTSPSTPPTQECPADEFLPPCQTRAFCQYRDIRTYATGWTTDDGRIANNATLCDRYLEELKHEEEKRHRKYLDTIEETIRGLETRLKAVENWKRCQQEKEDGHRSLDPRDGNGFMGQWQSTMKVGDVIGHSIWPGGIPLGACCFGFEADRECDESNRCKY